MDNVEEISKLANKLYATLPEELRPRMAREIDSLFRMVEDSPEQVAGIQYLTSLLDLPWDYDGPPHTTFKHIKKTLDKSHYGMQETKDLVLEYLSVMKMPKSQGKNPIFLLLGPPGLGKTTIAVAIAKSLNRPIESIFMGGMNDPRDLMGMSRFFQASHAGLFMKAYMKTKSRYSVLLLDELDKCSDKVVYSLLQVLDYSQNTRFKDMYIDLPYDMSSTVFIATANDVSKVHPALLDRMEIIELESYTLSDKLKIGRDYILPKVIANTGLSTNHLRIDQNTMRYIIQNYTREGGVRQLTRALEKIGRKITREVFEKKRTHFKRWLKIDEVTKYLGPIKYPEFPSEFLPVGSVNGLAYNGVGGMVLTIETALTPTKIKPSLLVTGLPGPMTDESSKIVLSLLKAKGHEWNLDIDKLHNNDLHIHYPECTGDGVDGPSAGGAMFLAVYSLLKGITIPSHIAMTGEINLRGNITEIGGLKEKLMAADRMKKTVVFIPYENVKDLLKVPEETKKNIKIIPIKTIYELLSELGV